MKGSWNFVCHAGITDDTSSAPCWYRSGFFVQGRSTNVCSNVNPSGAARSSRPGHAVGLILHDLRLNGGLGLKKIDSRSVPALWPAVISAVAIRKQDCRPEIWPEASDQGWGRDAAEAEANAPPCKPGPKCGETRRIQANRFSSTSRTRAAPTSVVTTDQR
jgi:hypothetical protein